MPSSSRRAPFTLRKILPDLILLPSIALVLSAIMKPKRERRRAAAG